jgi:MarR family 2-MHQ and catechol resistance regulon transcriptional repressor
VPVTQGEPHQRSPQAHAQALDLFVKLMRASRAVFAAVEPSIAVTGLTPTQFGVLEALLHKGALSHGELRNKVLTNLTDVIDKLEARGLLSRKRGTGDARRICVELSPAGEQLIAAAFPAHAAQIAAAIGRLEPAEQTVLATLLRKLGLAVEPEAPK